MSPLPALATLVIAACLTATAAAQPATPQPSAEQLKAHMTALSHAGMQGRRPGTAGEAPTLAYIEAAFAKAGLEPGGPEGWRQPVRLVERRPEGAALIAESSAGKADLSDAVLLLGAAQDVRIRAAHVIYAGHADVPGAFADAVVLYRDRARPGKHPLEQTRDDDARRALLTNGQAAIRLSIVDARQLARLKTRAAQGHIESGDAPQPALSGYIEESAARRLLALGGDTLEDLDRRAAAADFAPVPLDVTVDAHARTQLRSFTSYNVIGRLRGSTRPDEALLYTAHWDGFGHCQPQAAESICYGAIDNASGVAGLFELARLFASGARPDRSLLFIATTAEEYGLLGARAYAANPVIPLAKTVASLNIDTITLYGAGHPVGFVGAGITDADALIADAAAAQGRTLDAGNGARFVALSSDAWPLLRAGVPAFILSGTIAHGADKGDAFQTLITTRLHTPADRMDGTVVVDGGLQDIALAHAIGTRLARRDTWIDFLPGSVFRRPAGN